MIGDDHAGHRHRHVGADARPTAARRAPPGGVLGGHFIVVRTAGRVRAARAGVSKRNVSSLAIPELARTDPQFAQSALAREPTIDFAALFRPPKPETRWRAGCAIARCTGGARCSSRSSTRSIPSAS
jgi:hypothetical protein